MALVALSGLLHISMSQQLGSNSAPIEIRELVDNGTRYVGRSVIVHGCLIQEFEINVLQPCDTTFSQFSKYAVWIDELGTKSKTKLANLGGSRDQPTPVVMQAKYEESKSRKYGHLSVYKRHIIVEGLINHGTPVRPH